MRSEKSLILFCEKILIPLAFSSWGHPKTTWTNEGRRDWQSVVGSVIQATVTIEFEDGLPGMPKLSKILPSFSFSNFENFRELPSKNSQKYIALILILEFREFLRISRESSKVLEFNFSQGCRNKECTCVQYTPNIFS